MEQVTNFRPKEKRTLKWTNSHPINHTFSAGDVAKSLNFTPFHVGRILGTLSGAGAVKKDGRKGCGNTVWKIIKHIPLEE